MRRWRTGVALAVVFGVALIGPAACSGDGGGAGGAPTTTTVVVTPVDAKLAMRAVEAGIAALSASPGVAVTGSANDESLDQTYAIEVDRAAGRYRSLERAVTSGGATVVVEQIATAEVIYIRSIDEAVDDDPFWQALPVTDPSQVSLDEAFTLFGRASGPLSRLLDMWAEIPLEIQALTGPDGTSGYRFTTTAGAVADYLTANRLEAVSEFIDPGTPTGWGVWLHDGMVRRLEATGTQFFDGEAIDGSQITVDYRPRPVSVSPPPPDRVVG